MYQLKEEDFFKDVADHKITVIRDDGQNRHIRFSRGGSMFYRFDLITWGGHLCITGDCGTYVFSRTPDMFEFFRTDKGYAERHPEQKLFINPRYWGEKLLSICRQGGFMEFSPEGFTQRVTEHFEQWKESEEPNEQQADELWEEIDSQVLSQVCDGEHRACIAANDFEHEGFQFTDFFDRGIPQQYTYHYLWCLYAINWGISQYDLLKTREFVVMK